jgi:putative FmdB family regulatory protein
MPLYEYMCQACGKEFVFLKLGAEQQPRCPHCGSQDVRKKLSAFACGPGSGGGSC